MNAVKINKINRTCFSSELSYLSVPISSSQANLSCWLPYALSYSQPIKPINPVGILRDILNASPTFPLLIFLSL